MDRGGGGGNLGLEAQPRIEAGLRGARPSPSPPRAGELWSPRPRLLPRRVLEIMNPVYSPGSSAVPYANAKEIGYPAVSPWVMQQLLPTPPTRTLERILPFKQVTLLAHLTKCPVPPPAGRCHRTPPPPTPTRPLDMPCEVPTPSRARTHSKARTTPSPCMQHPLTSSTTPQWCSPTACQYQRRCPLLPSLCLEATGSPWARWRGPL